MPRVASGAITITDVTDGTTPISAFLTNENHTFPADTTGSVGETDRQAFSSTPTVFVGTTAATYTASTPTTNNTFTVGTIASSNNTWTAVVSGAGVITVSDIPTGTTTTTLSTVLTVPLTVRNSGVNVSVSLSISLSKAVEGAGGAIVQMTPNKQFFSFDADGTESPSGQTNIILLVNSQGNTGTLTATKSIDGGTFSALVAGAGADQAATIDIDGSGGDDAIAVSVENFSDSETLTIRVVGAAGGTDSVSIVRVRAGATGAAALIVVVESDSGTTFKTTDGSDVTRTLSCRIYDAATGAEIDPRASGTQLDVSFTWTLGDSNGTQVRVTSSSNRNIITSGGTAATGTITSSSSNRFDQLIVDATDVSTLQQYTCVVSVPDA